MPILLVTLFLIISIALGIFGFYIGYVAFQEYTNYINNAVQVKLEKILYLSTRFAVASGLIFFALISILGTFFEKKVDWLLTEVLGLFSMAGVLCLITFIGSLYQIYTTVKYRDLLIDKRIIKPKK